MIVIIYHVFFSNPTTSPSSSNGLSHSISYQGRELASSSNTIPNTSNGIDTIYYAKPTGVFAYNINTNRTTLYSSKVAKGLAYTTNLLILDTDGNLFIGTNTTPFSTGVLAVYDTTDGYAINNGTGFTYNGSITPANGNYNSIQYTVM